MTRDPMTRLDAGARDLVLLFIADDAELWAAYDAVMDRAAAAATAKSTDLVAGLGEVRPGRQP